MNKCLYCGKPVKNKYCDVSCQNKHQGTERENKKYGELKPFNVLCKNCGKEFEVEEREKLFPKKEFYYCSKKCSYSKPHTEESKDKIRKSLLNYNIFIDRCKKNYICLYCGKEFKGKKNRKFCNVSCKNNWFFANDNEKYKEYTSIGGKIGGKISVLSQNRRSKNEVYFSELCCSFFNNVKLNEPIFNGWDADVILDDYKLAFYGMEIGIINKLE